MKVNGPIPDIHLLVPHQGRMCLLDSVTGHGDDWLEAEILIRPETLFLEDDGVGAWVGLEYMAQAIAAYGGVRARARGEPVKIGFLLGTRRYDCSVPAFPPGSRLRVRVERDYEGENGLSVFRCWIKCNSRVTAEAMVSVFQPADPAAYLREGRS